MPRAMEKRGVLFTFISELLCNSKILCKFASDKGVSNKVITKNQEQYEN